MFVVEITQLKLYGSQSFNLHQKDWKIATRERRKPSPDVPSLLVVKEHSIRGQKQTCERRTSGGNRKKDEEEIDLSPHEASKTEQGT